MNKVLFFLSVFSILISCQMKREVDLIIHHAKVYTVDSVFSIAESFAVKNGKIVEIGTNEAILSKYVAKDIEDLEGKSVYPGFIDAHCHFYGYGLSLQQADLSGTKSFEEVLEKLIAFKNENKISHGWLTARGWDQNDWELKEFPDNSKLDSLFPDIPVILKRIDGHAALVNSLAFKMAGINTTSRINGGKVEINNGKPTGILIDNAIDVVTALIPQADLKSKINALEKAQSNCFKVGLTTVSDAGLDYDIVQLIDSLQKNQKLEMRIYAMLNPTPENMGNYIVNGIYKTDRLNVRSVKLYGDGALGSRGAFLKQAYTDDNANSGMMLQPLSHYEKWAGICKQYGYQLNTHCIGDAANHFVLNLYSGFLQGKNDLRWRIEHSQIVDSNDMELFAKYSIIPSVQPVHATSDMYWAKDRLGAQRIKYAYAYKNLLKETGILAYGSDFPVEDINPIFGFYAAACRKDLNGYPKNGFQIENALTRIEALKAMTIWAAFSNFEEKEKGSLEKGKWADFVVLDQDILQVEEDRLYKTRVKTTFLGGEKVY
jgi:predicted amidohydrolase YtcJ